MGVTDRDKKLLAIFAVVVILGGYWFLILGGKRSAVADAEKAVSEAQTALASAEAEAQQGQIEKKRYPVSYSRVLRMGKAIPVDSDYPSLLVQVNDITEDTGVNFMSLTVSEGTTETGADPGATGVVTTCEVTASTSTSTPGASPATGATSTAPTGATGSTAQSGVGKAQDQAEGAQGAANADGERAASTTESVAADCATAPTFNDVNTAAKDAGLSIYNYEFTFEGSFFDLYKVYDELLGMVRVKNGRINVTGRLLQINSINTTVKTFPELSASVSMTGYSLPIGTTIAAGATASGPAAAAAPAPAASPAPAPAPAPDGGAPPAAFVMGGN